VNQQNHDDRVIRLDPTTGQCIAGPFQGHTGFVDSVAYSPDGSHVVSGSDDDTIRVWDLSTGQCVVGPFWGHEADHDDLSMKDALASFREMYQQEDGWIKLSNAFAGSLPGLLPYLSFFDHLRTSVLQTSLY
jgi:WD40 repeat protein